MDSSIIRKYDIRGIVGKDLHIGDGYEIGRKFGQCVASVCVGYDSRITSPSIEKELIRGLVSSGANVIRVGLCSSPMLYTATQITQAEVGIIITASHNPSEYNGFKFFSSKKVYSDEEIKEILSCTIRGSQKIGNVVDINIYDRYINILKNAVQENSTKRLKIAWDCGNSPAGGIMRYIERILPNHTHIVINDSIDGTFPLHAPDPMEEKNLAQLISAVKEHKCDLGIALDGDGDRYQGDKIIANVKMSMKIHDFVKKLGGQVITCATGHSLIKKKMIAEDAKFAGELSGHFFFSELGFDDGLYSAMRAIDILLKKEQNLSEIIEDLPELYITHEIKLLLFFLMEKLLIISA
ncbi:PREDICTED: phosphomannomutase-like [Rhagoletis zephyria]|uniref:phosphomannomutase-like n=1 Tax=Rhagoletis zephyria TaxID=28612 RepID=UPI0008118D3B|nr:PREDICTED: phosphomannomutase-like [Rhagoletis zephyria]